MRYYVRVTVRRSGNRIILYYHWSEEVMVKWGLKKTNRSTEKIIDFDKKKGNSIDDFISSKRDILDAEEYVISGTGFIITSYEEKGSRHGEVVKQLIWLISNVY